MRIIDLKVLVLGTARRDLAFVRLDTDEGLVGVSESALTPQGATVPAYLEAIAPGRILGADPFETGKLIRRIREGDRGRGGEIVGTAVSLVEVACWDLVGKAVGIPVYRLFGGAVRDRIKAMVRGWQPQERTADAFGSAAIRLIDQGYRALVFEPLATAGPDPSRAEIAEAARLGEAVRAAVGPDVEILVELGGRFGPEVAVRVARALGRIEPGWVGGPAPGDHPRAVDRAARALRIPVAAGQSGLQCGDFRELFERRACDIVTADLMRCGGFTESRTIAAMAEAHAMRVVLRNRGGPVATAASLHLAATLADLTHLEVEADNASDEAVKTAAIGCPEIVNGLFWLPQGPGLGMTLDEEIIRAHPIRTTPNDQI